jgi:CCR4-NOT transcription complex subunit 1
MQQPSASADDIVQIYERIYREIEQHLGVFQSATPAVPPQMTAAIRNLLEFIVHARQAVRDLNLAMALVQRAVEGLLDGYNVTAAPGPEQELMSRYRDCHVLVLRAVQESRTYGPQWTNKNVTR